MKRYCLALDLVDDENLIREYETHHQKVWPEVLKNIADSGIIQMEIYRTANRLFMIMETDNDFSFERKQQLDQANEKVYEWEQLMWKYQQGLPHAGKGVKWMLMQKIFEFSSEKN